MRRVLLVVGVLAVLAVPCQAVDKDAIDRAIASGVDALRKLQRPDGGWRHDKIGATALGGVTLLECGAEKDDLAVKAAAAKIREASYSLTDTYSLSLSILFLDRLDNPADTPLIESMLVRLMAGHTNGVWSYECPRISDAEMRRLKAETSGSRELRGSRDLDKLPAKGKRKTEDLPKEIQDQIELIARGGAAGGPGGPPIVIGDHSNTQFATIALWVGRRYGLPTQPALLAIDRHYRSVQNPDGGWSYSGTRQAGMLPGAGVALAMPGAGSTAAMTCAGLLGLAVGHGASLDLKKRKDPKLESSDVSKDDRIKTALVVLSTAVGKPTGWTGNDKPAVAIPVVSGRGYYYLWSLERVAVAYNLETIAKKDWYQWGAEVLLASQQPDGSWVGAFADSGCDTCFALLFLKRANFARDLSSGLSGGKGLGSKVLKSGGVGGSSLKDDHKGLAPTDIGGKRGGPGGESTTPPSAGSETKPPTTGETKSPNRARPKPRTPAEAAAARLSDDVVKASGERRGELLKEMRDAKGPEYTDALASVISQLDADGRRKAREALADRLTRMKEATLRSYLKDEDVEIRRAAALAVGQKDAISLAPDLISLLNDPESLVERAAHAALKALSGKDYGPASGAERAEKDKAIAAWRMWWQKKARE